MNLVDIARHLSLQKNLQALPISGISIDTRQIQAGDLFIALRGEQFDGHDFIRQALEKGAVAVLCERLDETLDRALQLIVPNTLDALTQLALCHRSEFPVPAVAVTGSNGKTTVKEMIGAILPKPALATQGNYNNHIGVPLTVLQLKPSHRYAVFELGANHMGEIAHSVAIVRPQVSVITNIAPAHIECFGSIENVARTKGEIYKGLVEGGIAIVNEDDNFAHFWDESLALQKVLRFSLHKEVDVFARDIRYNAMGAASFTLVLPHKSVEINLRVPGEHSIANALAAAAATFALGIAVEDIVQGLNAFQGVKGRMAYQQGKNGAIVIDDTYNANLRSVLAAIKVLAKRSGRRILVLGDLGELGSYTQAHHEEIGQAAREQGIDGLMTCGQHSVFSSQAFGASGKHYPNQEALIADLLTELKDDTTVLVKGSRSARMEKIVQPLLAPSPCHSDG